MPGRLFSFCTTSPDDDIASADVEVGEVGAAGEEDVLGGVMPEAEGDVAEDEGKRKMPASTPSKGRGERGGGRAAA